MTGQKQEFASEGSRRASRSDIILSLQGGHAESENSGAAAYPGRLTIFGGAPLLGVKWSANRGSHFCEPSPTHSKNDRKL